MGANAHESPFSKSLYLAAASAFSTSSPLHSWRRSRNLWAMRATVSTKLIVRLRQVETYEARNDVLRVARVKSWSPLLISFFINFVTPASSCWVLKNQIESRVIHKASFNFWVSAKGIRLSARAQSCELMTLWKDRPNSALSYLKYFSTFGGGSYRYCPLELPIQRCPIE